MIEILLAIPFAIYLTVGLLLNKYWMLLVVTGIALVSYLFYRFVSKDPDSLRRAVILWVKLIILGIILLWMIYHDQMKM